MPYKRLSKVKNNALLYFLWIFILFVPFSGFSQFWEQVENFPGTARDDGTSFQIGTKYYCGLGRDVGFNCMRDFFVFDSANSTWSNSGALPFGQERQYANGTSWNGKGYVSGGLQCDGTYLNDLWAFDPTTNIWVEMTSLPAMGRAGSVNFSIQDTFYIVGGKNDSGILSEVWAYDFTNDNWTQKTNLPGDGIWRGLAFQWNGIGYAGMGKNNLNSQTEFNTEIYSFEPQTQSWNLEPDFGLTPRTYIGTAQNDSLLFLFGGVNQDNTIQATFDRLNISDWTLQALASFSSEPRKGGMTFLVNDIFYVTTGVSDTQRFNETWRIYGILNSTELLAYSFKIYPNPSLGICTIEIKNLFGKVVEITSIEGKFMASFEMKGNSSFLLDLSNYSNGIYFVRIDEQIQKLEIVR